MLGENANTIIHVHKAMVVLHFYNKIMGIPLPGYPRNKKKTYIDAKTTAYIDAYQSLSCIYLLLT